MPRLFRLTFFLTSILMATLFAMKAIGTLQSSVLKQILTNPPGISCKEICLFGIEPQITTVQQAKTLLENSALIAQIEHTPPPYFSVYGKNTLAGRKIFIYVDGDENIPISEMNISVFDSIPREQLSFTTLGEIVALRGEPIYALLGGGDTITFYWADGLYARIMPSSRSKSLLEPRIDGKAILVGILTPSALYDSHLYENYQFIWCGFTPRECPLHR